MDISSIQDIGDLMPSSVTVKAGGRFYVVKEADTAARVAFKKKAQDGIRFGPDGKIQSVDTSGEAEILLLGLCVFDCDQSTMVPHADPLGVNAVRKWSSKATNTLYKKLREISPGLDYDEEPTVAEYDKEIARLTKRRDEIAKAQKEGQPDPKAQGSSTGDTSA